MTNRRCKKSVVFTAEQREILFEFLLFHALVPLDQMEEALYLLEEEAALAPNKKEVGETSEFRISSSRINQLIYYCYLGMESLLEGTQRC